MTDNDGSPPDGEYREDDNEKVREEFRAVLEALAEGGNYDLEPEADETAVLAVGITEEKDADEGYVRMLYGFDMDSNEAKKEGIDMMAEAVLEEAPPLAARITHKQLTQ